MTKAILNPPYYISLCPEKVRKFNEESLLCNLEPHKNEDFCQK